ACNSNNTIDISAQSIRDTTLPRTILPRTTLPRMTLPRIQKTTLQ
ncbi:unnamed protein product, partial [Didymodactylos carnosus]